MENDKLVFYNVSDDYIEYLRNIDDKVMYNKPEKHQRPYVGFLLMLNDMRYLVPLSSQIRKSNDVTIVIPDRVTETQKINNQANNIQDKIAVIKFNCMIPILEDVIKKIDLDKMENEDSEYRDLLVKEILFCSENKDRIIGRAKKAYDIFKKNKPYMKDIIDSCVDFPKLENAMSNYEISAKQEASVDDIQIKDIKDETSSIIDGTLFKS